MADFDPKLPIEDSLVDLIDINPALVDPNLADDFDDLVVASDEAYIDSDMADPAAGLEVQVGTIDASSLPVPAIDMTSIVKTRKVLASGEVVYDIRFNVLDVGADKYEVAYVKQ